MSIRNLVTSLADIGLHVSATAPDSPAENEVWLDTTGPTWKVYLLGDWRIVDPDNVKTFGLLDQTLPSLTQAMAATIEVSAGMAGSIGQTLPTLTQAMTGDITAGAVAIPTNFRMTDRTTTSITVEWDLVAGADGYEVRVDGASIFTRTEFQNWLELQSLDPDSTHTFEVRATEGAAVSDWSEMLTLTTLSGLEVSGALSQTLPSLTQAMAADVTVPAVEGDIAQTLGPLTQVMTGDVTAPAASLSIVGTSTTTPSATDSTSKACSKPAGTAEGMLLLAFVRIANNIPGTDASNITPPSGWTFLRLDSDSSGSAFRAHSIVYYKVAGASEPADYTWDRGTNCLWQIGIHAIDGHGGIDTHSGAGATSTSTMTLPSVSPSVAGCLLLASWAGWRSTRTSKWGAPDASLSEIYNLPAAATADVIGAMDASEILAASGATGTRSSTNSGTCDRLCGSMVAIAPA